LDAHSDNPIHFEGVIPNASNTPRNQVGGLAVFEGVLMRSRTGFAIALRREDGLISLRQVPYSSLTARAKPLGAPVIRGATALAEMMVIGTRALQFSSEEKDGKEEKPERLGVVIAGSIAMILGLFVVLPDLLAGPILAVAGFTGSPEESPVAYSLMAGLLRLVLLVAYVAGISGHRDIHRVFQYHGAEHKAALALEQGRDVTVARARQHDTLHPRCGTTLMALIVLLSVPGFALVDWQLPLAYPRYLELPAIGSRLVQLVAHVIALPVVIGAAFELLKACALSRARWARVLLWPGYALQRLTTRQPDDLQLEVAIVALFGALAIPPWQRDVKSWVVRGLEDDDSAPGYIPRSPAKAAPPGTESAAAGKDTTTSREEP